MISASAIDIGGIMDIDLDEALFARRVLGQGARRIVASDATKFGRRGLVSVCGFDAVGELFTDAPPPKAIGTALAAAGARLTLA